MITRKDWNSLSARTRREAAKVIFHHMSDEFKEEMSQEWHHNNDTWHDILFKSLSWTKDRKQVKAVVGLGL